MARRADKLIDTVSMYEQNTEYKFYLTPNDSFVAKWKGLPVAWGTDAATVHREAKRHIEQSCSVVWYPAILVERIRGDWNGTSGMGEFRVTRLYVGKHFQGHWVKNDWDTPEDCRDATHPMGADNTRTTFPIPIDSKGWQSKTKGLVIEYDEAKYEKLKALEALIQKLWKEIDTMLDDESLTQMLGIAEGQLPLMLGSKEEVEPWGGDQRHAP